MKRNLGIIGILTLAAATVSGCQSERGQIESATPAGACRSDAASALSGRARLTDEQAKQETGATVVRQIKPGQGVTMDYRRERLTVETDPKTGRIVRAICG